MPAKLPGTKELPGINVRSQRKTRLPKPTFRENLRFFLRDFFRENSRFFVIFCIFCEITPPQAYDFAKVRFESANSGFPTPMISQNLPTCPMAIHPSKVGCKPHNAKVGALGGADAKRGGISKKKSEGGRAEGGAEGEPEAHERPRREHSPIAAELERVRSIARLHSLCNIPPTPVFSCGIKKAFVPVF